MWSNMKVNQLSAVIIISSLLLYFSLALDVCKDTDNINCQSCGDTVYRDEFYRQNCMMSCGVCTAKSVNVALGQQSVQQSSTNYGADASRAVDGNTDSDFINGQSCTHTIEGQSGWWCVDLQQLYYFNQIKMYNIQNTKSTSCYKDTTSTIQSVYTVTGCNQGSSTSFSGRTVYVSTVDVLTLCEVEIFAGWGRLKGFETKTSSSGQCSEQGLQSATSCYKDTASTVQSVYTVTGCNQGSSTSFSGRTVYISSRNDSLTLCEVEIFVELAQCNTGYYSTSSSTCQPCNTCFGNTCDPSNGVCTGDCKTGFYGTICQQKCNEGCLNKQCSKSDGRCNDCKPDIVGSYCNLTCGTECQPRTDQTMTTCDRTGRCTNCITGRYGDRCDNNCSMGCDDRCDRSNGRCTSCIKGKTGDRCDINCNTDCVVCNQDNADSCIECKDGRWGSSCNKLCNINCKSVTGTNVGKCDQMTGKCKDGCSPGKKGSNCTIDCERGRYGENCESKCNCADETPCDIITGSCGLVGCADGFLCPACQERIPLCSSAALSPVVYVIIGFLCGMLSTIGLFLTYHFYKKRSQSNKPKDDTVPDYVYSNTDSNPTTSTTDGYQNIPTDTRNVDYVNQSFNTEDKTTHMYDTLEHTAADTNNMYTSIECNKTK